MLPLIRQQEIEHHGWPSPPPSSWTSWPSPEITPGPLAVNAATYIGYQTAGIGGALLATGALAPLSLAGMVTLAAAWQRYRYHPLVHSIMGASPGRRWLPDCRRCRKTGMGHGVNSASGAGRLAVIALAAGAFLALRFARVHPALIMILGGLAGSWSAAEQNRGQLLQNPAGHRLGGQGRPSPSARARRRGARLAFRQQATYFHGQLAGAGRGQQRLSGAAPNRAAMVSGAAVRQITGRCRRAAGG